MEEKSAKVEKGSPNEKSGKEKEEEEGDSGKEKGNHSGTTTKARRKKERGKRKERGVPNKHIPTEREANQRKVG